MIADYAQCLFNSYIDIVICRCVNPYRIVIKIKIKAICPFIISLFNLCCTWSADLLTHFRESSVFHVIHLPYSIRKRKIFDRFRVL